MRFCTIVARNYVSQALVLAGTLAEQHPAAPLTILLVDADDADVDELGAITPSGVELLRTDELVAVDGADLSTMRTFYDVTEYSTALKPALLAHLRDRDGGVVVYLDPDIAVLGPLDRLEELAMAHGIVLTPHVTEPMPRDGLSIDERTLLRAGIFNLGFIGVGPGTERFLSWWWARLRTDAINDPSEGLFTDQRWIDFVPALFDHVVVRDLGWNVAYWNLHERPLSRGADGRILAGGAPVAFFHFSGYDPATPHVLSKHQGTAPRILVSSSPILTDLLAWYGVQLETHGHELRRAVGYRWGSVDGVPLSEFVRRLHRRAALGTEFGTEPGPDAFTDPAAFLAWLNAPVARSARSELTRLQLAYWTARIDLQFAFPHPTGTSLDGLVAWFTDHADEHVRSTLEPFARRSEPPAVAEARFPSPGVLVAGYLNAELGVGESARLLLAAAGATGLPVGTLGYRRTLSRQLAAPAVVDVDADVDLAVVCVNADQTPAFFAEVGDRIPSQAMRAGMWFWEVPDFPASYWGAFDLVDEVWVASSFVGDAIAAHTDRPVRVVPLPIVPDPPSTLTRADLGLPDDAYLFGFACDGRSVLTRKNPLGVLRAYLDAFPSPASDTHLVLKLMNGHVEPVVVEHLRWLSRDRPDVDVVDATWDPAAIRALTQRIDCYVSLHRSEGYGLGLAQAMAQGKPVIATGWSGNLAFMTDTTSFLVPSTQVPVGHAPPYPANSHWAEPDHDAAVDILRTVRARPGNGVAVGELARLDVARRFSVAAAGTWLREQAIDASRAVATREVEARLGDDLRALAR